MILEQEKLNVEKKTNNKVTTFSIKSSAQAMIHLSSTLYTHKIKAVIRELCCNAYDAHVAAGKKDIPFEVYLPTTMNPEFCVKDCGTGMSDEKVETLYTTYFESSKTESNEFIGALGLGSKSPFCYTDQFTIESRYNGNKSIYTAFYDENYIPSLTKLFSAPTDEENGMTIKFGVKNEDIFDFEYEANEVLKYFDIIPKVYRNGEINIFPFDDECIYKSDKLVIKHGYSSGVLQGNVLYELPISKEIKDKLVDFAQEQFITNSRFWDLLEECTFKVPLGTVSFAPNRETLSLDKRTINNLASVIKEAFLEYKDSIKKEYSSKKTTMEKYNYLCDNEQHACNFKEIYNLFHKKCTIRVNRRNGKPFKDGFKVYAVSGGSYTRGRVQQVDKLNLQYANSYIFNNVFLCETRKEATRISKYLKSTNEYGIIVLGNKFDDKAIKILTNKFCGLSWFTKSEDVEFKAYTSSSSYRRERNNRLFYTTANNIAHVGKSELRIDNKVLCANPETCEYHLRTYRNTLDEEYYGISKKNAYLLTDILCFLQLVNCCSMILLCDRKSKHYDKSKDFIFKMFEILKTNKASIKNLLNIEIFSKAVRDSSIYRAVNLFTTIKSEDEDINLISKFASLPNATKNIQTSRWYNFYTGLDKKAIDKYKVENIEADKGIKEVIENSLIKIHDKYPLLQTYGSIWDVNKDKYFEEYVNSIYKCRGENK